MDWRAPLILAEPAQRSAHTPLNTAPFSPLPRQLVTPRGNLPRWSGRRTRNPSSRPRRRCATPTPSAQSCNSSSPATPTSQVVNRPSRALPVLRVIDASEYFRRTPDVRVTRRRSSACVLVQPAGSTGGLSCASRRAGRRCRWSSGASGTSTTSAPATAAPPPPSKLTALLFLSCSSLFVCAV